MNKDEDVTTHCYAKFSDEKESRKAYKSLDSSGWVFTSVKSGDTYLDMVLCTVGGMIKHNITYETRELKFSVPGDGKAAYFGHLTIQMDYQMTTGATIATVLAGSIGGAIAGDPSRIPVAVKVENQFSQANEEYVRRYGDGAKNLPAVDFTMVQPKKI